MGGRTHICMARPMQTPSQGLGNLHRIINDMGSHRIHSNDRPKDRKLLLRKINF